MVATCCSQVVGVATVHPTANVEQLRANFLVGGGAAMRGTRGPLGASLECAWPPCCTWDCITSQQQWAGAALLPGPVLPRVPALQYA